MRCNTCIKVDGLNMFFRWICGYVQLLAAVTCAPLMPLFFLPFYFSDIIKNRENYDCPLPELRSI